MNNLPDPRCAGADWVRPIKRIDVYRRFYQLGILASSGAAIYGIATAEPAGAAAAAEQQATQDEMLEDGSASSKLQPQIGSNAYALRQGGDRERPRPRLRQPALPLGRLRAPLPGPPQDPGQGGRRRRLPLRRAAGPDRPHARPRLVAHRRHRLALHAVQADPRRRTLTPTSSTARRRTMEETEVTVKALQPDDSLDDVTRSIYSTEYGPMLDEPRRHPAALGAGQRLRARRRQRHELPLPQPLPRQQPRADRSRVRRDPAPLPGHPVGQLDRGRLEGRGVLLDAGRDPLRGRRASRPSATSARPAFDDPRAADPRRLALGLQLGRARTRRPRPAPSRPTRCRPCSATTTSTTATTRTGSRTPRRRSPDTTGSSGSRRPSAPTARGSA